MTPEEELEKQYRDYKVQFEQWKEKNKNSVGTEAYLAYVKQFEAWERDVDHRREMIRAKAESSTQDAQVIAQVKAKAIAVAQAVEIKRRKEQENDELQKKQQLEAEAAAQAAAYAQHQQSYLAHHQAALQKEQQMRQNASSASLEMIAARSTEAKPVDGVLNEKTVAEMMKQMAQVAQYVMGGKQHTADIEGSLQTSSQISQQAPVQAVPPPKLWGSDRITFDANDPMYKRWGLRAAPPYHNYTPPPFDQPITPGWWHVLKMKSEKLVPLPQMDKPPPQIMAQNHVPS